MYQVHENCLVTEHGAVEFRNRIKKVLEWRDIVIVRLEIMGDTEDNDNVYGIKDGKIIWRVQPQYEFKPYIWSGAFTPLGESKGNPYCGIDIYKKDPSLIIAVDACGFRYLIDPATGKIVGEESWVK